MKKTTGLMVTPKLIEVVRSMRDGGWWAVTNNDFVARRISASIFQRLLKLGWIDYKRDWFDNGRQYRTNAWLNDAGMARAAEFDNLSEVNAGE